MAHGHKGWMWLTMEDRWIFWWYLEQKRTSGAQLAVWVVEQCLRGNEGMHASFDGIREPWWSSLYRLKMRSNNWRLEMLIEDLWCNWDERTS